MKESDLLIIGGGPAGYEIAAEAANEGLSVTLVEKDALGGTCLNRGCILTKCFCASAQTILAIKEACQFGVNVSGVSADFGIAAERARKVMDQLRAGIETLLAKVQVVHGEASLRSADDVPNGCAKLVAGVNGEEYAAKRVLIATGSKPAVLPIPGAELAITSDEFLRLDAVPARVVIIGGGVIGMEFASILNAYGVEVTVVEYCPEILPPFDKEVAKRLRTALTRRGVKVMVGCGVKSISCSDGALSVAYEGKRGQEAIECDAVVMAVGRKPVVPAGASEAGLEISARGFIVADDNDMSTSVPGVYAVGDVNGKCMLAHAASAQAKVALGRKVDLSCIPSAVFTVPECAMVGLTEEQCKAMDIAYGKGKAMFAANGKALAMGEGDGFLKVLYSADTRAILGVSVIGPHASDLVAEATACMVAKMTVDDVATTIVHGHPTLSEAFSSACCAAR